MATRPGEPSQLGKFFDYPSDATGQVLPYWLASSPGNGHRVRMDGACKRAFLATIEAIIERSLVPANCDAYPAANTDFKTIALNVSGLYRLVDLGAWTAVANRSGLGARLKRGCPLDDWMLMVSLTCTLWSVVCASNPCGTVYAWQADMLDYETDGWVDDSDITDAYCQDLSFNMADNSVAMGGQIELRLWGDYAGGAGGYPVAEWIVTALNSLGANVQTPSLTPGGFADDELNGSPAPLERGHEGNWFGSSPGSLRGDPTVRRSSSAWAVIQAMLANMRFTHLLFPYGVVYEITTTTRTVERIITMDDDGSIVVVESNQTETTSAGTDRDLVASMSSDLYGGLSWLPVRFYCQDEWIDEDCPLVKFAFPGGDGWYLIGSDLEQYLTFGDVHVGAAVLTLWRTATTGIDSVSAANGHSYPCAGFQAYVDQYGGATFVDAKSYYPGGIMSDMEWTKFSVRHEAVAGTDLTQPVRDHAGWLLNQLPTIAWPSIPENPGKLTGLTNRFWNGWKVLYPDTPNIQVDGRDAFFPVKFKNPTVVDHVGWIISHDQTERTWTGGSAMDGSQGEVFGTQVIAFPNFDPSAISTPYYKITPYNSAMAAYKWAFKAMPAT